MFVAEPYNMWHKQHAAQAITSKFDCMFGLFLYLHYSYACRPLEQDSHLRVYKIFNNTLYSTDCDVSSQFNTFLYIAMVMMVVGWLWVLMWVKRVGKKAVMHRNNTEITGWTFLYLSHCRTRSWGPGYIVGFRRVKVPSVRSILYSTT
jgi:hypothetical protein